MKKYLVPLIQIGVLIVISLVIHYSIFSIMELYDQNGSIIAFLRERELSVYFMHAVPFIGFIYGQIYRTWRKLIWRSIAIAMGNLLLYIYIVEILQFGIGIARILLIGSIIGWFISYSSIKKKGLLLTIDLVIIVVMILLESIPVYTKTVSTHILLRNQATFVYFQPTNSDFGDTLEITTSQRTQSYNLASLIENPLRFPGGVESVSYFAEEGSYENPIIIQSYNGTITAIAPQTKVSFLEEKNYMDPITSHTSIDVQEGYVEVFPLNDASNFILNQKTNTSGVLLSGIHSYTELYVENIQNNSKELFGRMFTDSLFFEHLSLYKMNIYQFFDFATYTPYLENFYKYRYLVYGKEPPFESEVLYFPIEEEIDITTEYIEETATNDALRNSFKSSLEKTQYLGDFLGE